MMQNNLFLQRLRVVTYKDLVAYDEFFHKGINIIRGKNSSGKSTIIRFIFFALGGHVSDFVPEVLKCKYVMAEVNINGTTITLKRNLERIDDNHINPKTSMFFYYGSIEDLLKDKRTDIWQCFGYNQTEEKKSFSNVLFGTIGIPEFKADSNITMHQILRLMYIDQESPTSSLFYFERFDKEITRETVAELLMGIYNEKLSETKNDLIDKINEIKELKGEIKIAKNFLSDSKIQSSKFINEHIDFITTEITKITDEIEKIRENTKVIRSNKFEYKKLQDKLKILRNKSISLENKISELTNDIEDSRYFIAVLNKKIESLNNSISTRNALDLLPLEYCPECLTKLEENVPEGRCRLCKSEIDISKGKSQALRIKLELEFQLQESLKLLEENNTILEKKKIEKSTIDKELKTVQKEFDLSMNNVRSSRDEKLDALIQEKGYKEGEIIQYRNFLETALKYENLLGYYDDLIKQKQIDERYIKAQESLIEKNRMDMNKKISENGVYLLKNDETRQEEFHEAENFIIDYKQNIAYISNKYSKFSASSSFYLKMAARFALFFTSLQIEKMLYPRLLFSDNMEDKGMEIERAKNFQRTIVQRLNEINNSDYQLIFATSNIADEFEKKSYVIGDLYTETNKSLKNV